MSTKRASASASRLREQLAARNGPRHSVYWVQPKAAGSSCKTPAAGSISYTEAGNMGATARAVEYKLVGKYTGDWKDGKKHGFGALVYANGSKYEGEWKDGMRHGRGVYWVVEGSSGSGKLRKQYAGDWVDDKRYGVGTLFYPNGARYEGFWVDNKREGTGHMEYAPDSTEGDRQGVYQGEWLDNERSGCGTLVLANGDRYDGYWLHDKKEGPGRFYYKATRKVYEGEWVDGSPKCGTYRNLPHGEGSDNDEEEADGAELTSAASHYKFQLPQLGLARPDQVVSEMVANIRQERVRDMALRNASVVDSLNDELQVEPGDGHDEDNGAGKASASPVEGVIFDNATLRLIQREFSAILAEQQQTITEEDGGEAHDAGRSELVACAELPRLLDAIQLRVPEVLVEDFMAEIGATPATRVSFAECVDMLSLLAESEAQRESEDDSEAFADGDGASVDDD